MRGSIGHNSNLPLTHTTDNLNLSHTLLTTSHTHYCKPFIHTTEAAQIYLYTYTYPYILTLRYTHTKRLGSPTSSAGDLNAPCRSVWRRAIHLFLIWIGLLREPIIKLAFPPGTLLVGLTQWRLRSDGKQPIVYRGNLTPPADHASCSEENDSSFPRPKWNLRLSMQ